MAEGIQRKQRISYSEAEDKFRAYMAKEHPELEVSKRGMPDFMLIKDDQVIGFVEVKRDHNDHLRKHQFLFGYYCKLNKIPYQVWAPYMAWKPTDKTSVSFRERWKKSREKDIV